MSVQVRGDLRPIRTDLSSDDYLQAANARLDTLLETYLGPDSVLGQTDRFGQRWEDGFRVMGRSFDRGKFRGSEIMMMVGFDGDQAEARALINHRWHSVGDALEEAGSVEAFAPWFEKALGGLEADLQKTVEFALRPPKRPEVDDTHRAEAEKTVGTERTTPNELSPEDKIVQLVRDSAGKGMWAGARLGWQLSSGKPLLARVSTMFVLAKSGAQISHMRSGLAGAFERISEESDFREAMKSKTDRGEPLRRAERKRLAQMADGWRDQVADHRAALRVGEHSRCLERVNELQTLLGTPIPESKLRAERHEVLQAFIEHANAFIQDVVVRNDTATVNDARHLLQSLESHVARARKDGLPLTAEDYRKTADAAGWKFQLERINGERMAAERPDSVERDQSVDGRLRRTHPFVLNDELAAIPDEQRSPRAKQADRERAWLHAMEAAQYQLFEVMKADNPFRSSEARALHDQLEKLLKWKTDNGLDMRRSGMMRVQRSIDGLGETGRAIERLEAEQAALEQHS